MSELVTIFHEAEVLVREEAGERVLTGIMVPWDVATPVDSSGRFAHAAGNAWESFQRGALDKTLTDTRQASLLYGGAHLNGPASSMKPAGYLLRSESTDLGQLADWKLYRNYEGDEALEMAATRAWTGFSISYRPLIGRTRIGELAGRRHFQRQEVALDHTAFLRNPAFEGAELLSMREELEALDPGAAARAQARLRILRRAVSASRALDPR